MTKTHTDYARRMETGMRLYLFPRYKRFRNLTVDLAEISPDDSILDYGCGVGLLEEFILPKLAGRGKVIGVDIGKELIEIAQKRFASETRCRFAVIDSPGQFPFESQSFDVVISSLVFHLLDGTQKIAVLKEFLRVLKPNGHLLCAEIGNPTGIFGRWIKFLTLHYWAKVWPYEMNSVDSFAGRLPEYLQEAGFRNIQRRGRLRGYIDFLSCAK